MLFVMVMMLQSPALTLVTAALNESSVETLPTRVEQLTDIGGAAVAGEAAVTEPPTRAVAIRRTEVPIRAQADAAVCRWT